MSRKSFSIFSICLILVAISMAQENPNDKKLLPLPVCLDGKSVYINRNGEVVLKTDFDSFLFSEGFAGFKENDKYGFIDETGKVVIEPTFNSARAFSEGFAAIGINGKAGFIDKSGKIIVQPRYDGVDEFANGFAVVKIENGNDAAIKKKYDIEFPTYKAGFVDKSGEIVIGKTKNKHIGKFDDAKDFSEGLAPVKIGEKWGFVNEKDQTVIRFRFKDAKSFSEGLAPVTINGSTWGYIDKLGKFVIEPQFTNADSFSEGLAAISKEKDGLLYTEFINKSGNIVIKPSFPFFLVGEFHEGRTYFYWKDSDLYLVFIDETGKIIFKEDNVLATPFKDGVAAIFSNDRVSYIDNTGKYIWSAKERNKETSSKCHDLSTSLKKQSP